MENGKWVRSVVFSAHFPFSIFHRLFASAGMLPTIQLSPPSRKTAGADARVGREPGQVRKEAALSGPGSVPSLLRSSSAMAVLFFGYHISRMKLFIVANPTKPNVAPVLEEWIGWMKQRATIAGVDTDCCT